jgi:HEAT repeat protein
MLSVLPGEEQIDTLLEVARATNLGQELRNTAIFGLAKKKTVSAAPTLISIIQDSKEDIDLRDSAVSALSSVGGPNASEVLMGVIRDPSFPPVTKPEPSSALGCCHSGGCMARSRN